MNSVILGFEIVKILSKLSKWEQTKTIYIAISVHADGGDKDLLLLGDEHNNKYYKPIGGVIKNINIYKLIDKKISIKKSDFKPRNITDGELAFESKKFKSKIKQVISHLGVINKQKTIYKILENNMTLSILKNNLIREINEEFQIHEITKRHINDNVLIAYELKQYSTGIARIHIYYILRLKKKV